MAFNKLPIGAGINTDVDDSTVADGASVVFVNCYKDRGDAVRLTPGRSLYADLGLSARTDAFTYYSVQHDLLLIIANGQLWTKRGIEGVITAVAGASVTADTKVTFTEDGFRIFFAANSAINMLDPAAMTVSALGGNAPTGVNSLAYSGGYLFATGDISGLTLTGYTHYSDDGPWFGGEDPAIVPPTGDYETWESYNNESNPDAAQALVVAFGRIYNIGRESVEASYIDGTVPISADKNSEQPYGTPAPYSVAFDQERIYFITELSGSRKLATMEGGGKLKVIDMPLAVHMEHMESIADARGYLMAFKGHNFYVCHFPSAGIEMIDQEWPSITLAYHMQTGDWLVLAKWDTADGMFTEYPNASFTYIEPWGLRLLGGNDGKLYELVERTAIDYTLELAFQHRWRDNGTGTWKLPRTISLGNVGDYDSIQYQRQIGQYRTRQHELIFSDISDNGELFRSLIRTGHVSFGTPTIKQGGTQGYIYNLKRGGSDFVINTIHEDSKGTGK